MSELPKCPKCSSSLTYEDASLFICPECSYEWSHVAPILPGEDVLVIRDAFGSILNNGDNITVIKDLKLKGSSATVKVGTKIKNIRIIEGDHNIDCRVDGIGTIQLKSEFVKKL